MTKIDLFDYHLPPELIAQTPVEPRDHSRLMVLKRKDREISHDFFFNLPKYLEPGDLLVVNNTRVISARLKGTLPTGGKGEVLLLRPITPDFLTWEALVRPGKKLLPGAVLKLPEMTIEVMERLDFGGRLVKLSSFSWDLIERLGEIPLPPYIKEPLDDPSKYQTLFAKNRGAVAAPTASLHFTPQVLENLRSKGVEIAEITLHAGLGTFRPVRAEEIEDHKMHQEEFFIPDETGEKILETKKMGKRVVAAGTTVVRTLEASAVDRERIKTGGGMTDLYILPGFEFKIVDAMITNFHLPKSTLLILISAFATREFILKAYEVAIQERYRFFSFGDAMLIL
ncbi:MAG: tRNA preQ1(34) S-adenosylmethionine ribosyltransferase-isomerase QueA [Caldiserica bacterium]|nr:tRNA preQ1(34) S-adenosylmethionine ribosyltransferase-isomerase QueA [Caldisericota bacterium]MDH7562945.1 tRNA preQ1(34) S-adenosylmethionine ribosyltransferase-isomerase QueA [Caldisericota bacterium]